MTQTKLDEMLRNTHTKKLVEMLINAGYDEKDVLQVGTNKIAIPVLDDERNEKFIEFTVKVPRGSKRDNEPYDAYDLAENFKFEQKTKAEKKAETEKKKQAKIERDKAFRQKQKELKEKREKGE